MNAAAVAPTSRQMESIDTPIMEPLMDGGFRETVVKKFAYQCLGCGLVWAIRWHADTCGQRNHTPTWAQRYVTGPIVNGKPAAERFYPRRAMRREALPQ